ncbi:aminotransferase class V-fold PLP-dependent enzyme [Gordonia aichiensis]|uniref:aminotransferase class V-fold PLP-dependent enzyme n=1 Tax=Gordonia aichiensis TaxID=36820 RepID=UPI0032633473
MALPHNDIDPDGLLEYSVVFTDRSLNHMSKRFVGVMQELLGILRDTYNAGSVAVVPGGGTYGMESVARQFATGKRVLVVRNGLFSFRWSQIFETGAITDQVTVCKARPASDAHQAPWSPAPIDEVVAAIREQRPEVVFAPHVETASGIVLPDEYLAALAAAVHEVGGVFVLDCVASGALWVDMEKNDVDVLLTAPQKGWSGTPCAGYVMLRDRGRAAVLESNTTSFALDLRKWLSISDSYVEGNAPYHATLPTDSLAHNAQLMRETVDLGAEELRKRQLELGSRVRSLLAEHQMPSVAAEGFDAATVVVAFTDDPARQNGSVFKQVGLQIAAGVPLQCDEGPDYSSLRIGLFGLDKLTDVDGTVQRLAVALKKLDK